jgi:UDP-2,3-diacylglucosamine pyrophosphatase LpxH
MLVVLSDLHFQEASTSGPGDGFDHANVRPVAFDDLWRQLSLLAERCGATGPITVVLNGDILEILRSERWLIDGTRPYNWHGALDPAALATARAIGDALLDDNAAAIAALRGPLADTRFVYVYGNHDRLLREEALAPVRARFASMLGGPSADVRFVDQLYDERHAILAQHGHELDWTCCEYQHARVFEGWDARHPGQRALAPLGDWVALELGTRLPFLAWQMLTADDRRWDDLPPSLRRDLYARLVGLEDLRPPGAVLSWLVRPGRLDDLTARASELAALVRFLGDLMHELVSTAMPRVQPWLELHGRPWFDRLALGAVELLGARTLTASALPAVMDKINAYLAGQDRPWAVLPRTDAWAHPGVSAFVSGHTHDARVVPVGESRWYVNSGTWRKTILRAPDGAGDAWGTVKQLAYAVFYDADETARATGGRSRTASFDFWQGASQRF